MAITYGFFNSLNGDRKYNADQMSNFYGGLIENGIMPGIKDTFAVSVSGLNTIVGTGRAMINNKWIENDSAIWHNLTGIVHSTLASYIAVTLRLDMTNREITIEYIQSDKASSPVKPEPVRTDTIYDLILAYIYLPAGASSLTTANLEDTRSDRKVCGYARVNVSIDGGKATITCDSSARYYNIPSTLNYEPTDILNVYANGLLINDLVGFTVMENEIEGGYQIKFDAYYYSEYDRLTFEVLKSTQ